SQRWCSYFEVDPAWLPPILNANQIVGTLRSAVATELGVPAGLPVKLGTADTINAMLAAGMQSGDLLHIAGPTHLLAALTSDPRPDSRRLICLSEIKKVCQEDGGRSKGNVFVQMTYNPVGCVALDWLRKLCFRDQSEQEFYQQSIPLARKHRTRV